jgi:RND family efflux transporter MFP subunit
MMSRTRDFLCLSVVVLGCAFVSARAQEMPPALVVTEPVTRMDFHSQISLVGRSAARAKSRIVAEVSGRVMSVDAREGRWVSLGRPLVVIDSKGLQLTLEAKQAEAAQAKADADLASKELRRAEDLFEQDILPERTLDGARAAAMRTAERYNELEAERKRLELDLSNCTIRAPYSGFTGRQLTQVGEWVDPGTPVYEMVDLSVVKVTVDLPERYFGRVAFGSSVSIIVSGDERQLSGRVTGIDPQASETTHTFPIIVSVPNKEGRLGGGMLVRATVSLEEKFSSLAVSKDAIVRQGDQTMVYTVVEGKATPIMVKTSSSNGMMVAVQGDGLEDGMPVVVRGNERIFPGSPVMTPDDGASPEEEAPQETGTSGSK